MAKKIIGAVAALFAVLILFQIRFDIPAEKLKEKYARENSKFIEIEGMNVHYLDEGTGFPLVLVHGTASSLHTWDGWAKELTPNFRVVRMDIPAYGLTGPNKNHDYSIRAYVAFLKAFLDRVGIKKCHMAGNSLGGNITWNFTVVHPGMIQKIILVDSAGYPRKGDLPLVFRMARTPLLKQVARYITPRYFVKKSLLEVYGDDSKVTDKLIDRYYDMALREGNRDAFIARANLSYTYDINGVKAITAPTLIMWGSDDEWIPVEDARNFKRDIPKSRLIIYDGIGHVPMEEVPEKTAADAKEFLL